MPTRAEPEHRGIDVLGVGAVSAAGRGLETLWRATLAARPLAEPVRRYAPSGCRTRRAALVPDEIVEALRATWPDEDLAVALCLEAAREALGGRALHPDAAVLVGTSLGGVAAWEPWHRARLVGAAPPPPRCATHDDVAPQVASRMGARGPALTLSSACTSGAAALIVAGDMVRAGEVPEALVLGVDVLGAFVHVGFDRLGALAPDDLAPAPFAADRAGLWLGEGCAALLLGRGPGVARYLGGASASDGVHMTAPDRDGDGMRRAISAALADARRAPSDIAWVSAHATATRYNDAMEAAALRTIFGDAAPPVHALKPVTGHTLGASGLLEAALATRALRERVRPPTASRARDPELPWIHLDPRAEPMGAGLALSINAAMAGHNTAIVLGAAA
ncbi:MAG: beta-ketoacyl synthase N-terminal-like domain-containing protein [Polyangiales bacterium]